MHKKGERRREEMKRKARRSVCVCVCVEETHRERYRKRDRERETIRDRGRRPVKLVRELKSNAVKKTHSSLSEARCGQTAGRRDCGYQHVFSVYIRVSVRKGSE